MCIVFAPVPECWKTFWSVRENAHGCFALKTTHGKHLVELKRELNKEVGYKGVQLVTISRPTAYGEYAPYHFVDTEQEFQTLVKGLRP